MKETITVKIIEGGKAMEVNPFGRYPEVKNIPICNNLGASFKAEQDYLFNLKKWQEAESKLRTFEIEDKKVRIAGEVVILGKLEYEFMYREGEVRQAKLLKNGKIEII